MLTGINSTNYFVGVSNILVYLLPPPHISGHHTKESMQVMQEDESKARDAAAL